MPDFARCEERHDARHLASTGNSAMESHMTQPSTPEANPFAYALAQALATSQGKDKPRVLRTAKDFKFLGDEVLKVIGRQD